MNLSTIDLNLMVAFDALMRERSVTRAGKALNLTQPAMSNALRRLRDLLSDPLLLRAGPVMVPTERALALHPQIRAALAQLQDALADKASFEPSTSELRFRIAITDHTAFVLLPALCRHIGQLAPGVSMEFSLWRGEETFQDLESGGVDLGIGIGQLPQPTRALHRERLFPDRFVCIVRRGHPLAGSELTLETYLALSHILVTPMGGAPRGVVDDVLDGMGLRRRIVVTVPHFLAAPFVVAQTDYIVTLSEAVSRPFANVLPLVCHEPPVALQGGAWVSVWHERTHRQPAHQWLRRELVQAARSLGS